MRDSEFEAWLISKYPKPGTWRTYLSETRKIHRYIGNLDILYDKDQFSALLKTFEFSKKDGILPTDSIPHDADPYVTSGFRRRCIHLYSEFCMGDDELI